MTDTLITHPCNCFALRQAARTVTALYDRHLEKAGLTTSQHSLLAVIENNPGIATQELSELMVMDRTTLVRALKPLSRDGYIQQLPDAANSRKLVFTLTETGRQKYAQAHQYWQQAQAEFDAGIGKSRAMEMRKELIALAHKQP
ncbi:MarR family winged helix-turn-helix transcriptional regulator [Duganella aceris]|uniref:Winged helix-turn-helix transcriptional regulator n=1 Tax=Duganella aceris TaxID=2703883 RepID=A0ABX0FTA5_9BURK|nr:MarR family winged helix-turn-helix transcriptional regulator [Duganella aceris]NGZ87689.1 winged helix-turn-helix transcriptional regulator [Duganella aceris]